MILVEKVIESFIETVIESAIGDRKRKIMNINTDDLLNSIMSMLDKVSYINSDDIPGIDLYVDQVTTFIDKSLKNSARNQSDEKVMTKTMINNYAKNELLPAPVKKKYSKEHVLMLIFIYYFKNIMSINDIQNIMGPLTDKYFGKDKAFSIKDIYDEVARLDFAEVENMKKDVKYKYEKSKQSFENHDDEDEREFLQTFSFVCMLAFDVYLKKLMIERIIDDLAKKQDAKEEKNTRKTRPDRKK